MNNQQPELLREGKSDSATYYKCAEPHKDMATAKENLIAFLEALEQARIKYSIANIAYIIKDAALDGDEVGEFMVPGFLGNSLYEPTMLAYAYGQAQAEHSTRVMKMLAGNAITKPRKHE